MSSRLSDDWREEMIGTVKLAVPMTTADARRAVNAVLSVFEAEIQLGDDGAGGVSVDPKTGKQTSWSRPQSRLRRFVTPWERVG